MICEFCKSGMKWNDGFIFGKLLPYDESKENGYSQHENYYFCNKLCVRLHVEHLIKMENKDYDTY